MVSILWVTVGCIIFLASVCAFGYLAGVNPIPDGDVAFITTIWLLMTIVVAVFWPLILGLAVITSPGWIAYLVGRKVRKRV